MIQTIKKLNDARLRCALKEAIQHEKDARDFYLLAAEKSVNAIPKLTFQMLAGDERDHAFSFYQAYHWPDIEPFDDLLAAPINPESVWSQKLQQLQLSGFNEAAALSFAIERERDIDQQLRGLAQKIEDPLIRDIYLTNANMTEEHLRQLKDDLTAIDTMD